MPNNVIDFQAYKTMRDNQKNEREAMEIMEDLYNEETSDLFIQYPSMDRSELKAKWLELFFGKSKK